MAAVAGFARARGTSVRELIIPTVALMAMIGFAIAAWWTGRIGEPAPDDIEVECMEDDDWSDQDVDDFTEYFGQFGEF